MIGEKKKSKDEGILTWWLKILQGIFTFVRLGVLQMETWTGVGWKDGELYLGHFLRTRREK